MSDEIEKILLNAINEVGNLATIPNFSNLEQIIERDIPGWIQFFNNPKFPELILWFQSMTLGFMKQQSRTSLVSEDGIRRALYLQAMARGLEIVIGRLMNARDGFVDKREKREGDAT